MPVKVPGSHQDRQIQSYVPKHVAAALDRVAQREGTTRAGYIRKLILTDDALREELHSNGTNL